MTAIREVDPATATVRQADGVTSEFEADVDEIVSHYPVSKRSASLPLLHYWQNHFGHVDDSGIEWIAARLELQPVNIYELVTFYPWFRREAAGKTIIRVCRTLACAMAGSYAIKERFCARGGTRPAHRNITATAVRRRRRRMEGSAWNSSNASPVAEVRRWR